MSITILAIGFAVILAFLWLFDKLSRPKNSPPGPFVFPVVGIYPYFIKSTFFDKMQEWSETYGKIFSFRLGAQRTVIIHDFNLIKEAFNMNELTARPYIPVTLAVAGKEKRGLTASEGAQWEAQRRFAVRHLRNFGFGKKSMESMAHEDILDLIESFKKEVGHPISTTNRFNMSVISSLWHIISGQRYNLESTILQDVIRTLKVVSTSTTNPAFAMDWLVNLAPDLTGWKKFKTNLSDAQIFIKEEIQNHKNTFQEENFRDYMDVFINEIKKSTDTGSSFYGNAGEENLMVGTLNIFAAATETTSATLNWSLLYLSQNPKIQKKFQDEIDSVVGRSRLPSLEDRNLMVYTNAIILEVLRKSSVVPMGVPHCTLANIKLHGYTIAKGTAVFADLYGLHNDKKIWGDPHVFRPERFLTPDGKGINKNHPVMAPFSVGKRQCLGETLAQNNVFLFLVSLFQHFDIILPVGETKVSNPFTFIRFPSEFKVIFEERKLK